MASISYWDLGHCLYVEHFAVEQAQRGQGTGSEVLRQFCSQAKTAVVLEINPPVDEVSRERLRFYDIWDPATTHSHLPSLPAGICAPPPAHHVVPTPHNGRGIRQVQLDLQHP